MTTSVTSQIEGTLSSLAIKAPVHSVATTNITLSGLQTVGGVVLDGSTLYRVLCTAQTNSVDNGIWDASTGSWSRAKDFDGPRDAVKGTLVIVQSSTNTLYRLTTSNPIVPGTTALTFELAAANLTQADLTAIGMLSTGIKYDITPAEDAAGVVPVNYYLEPGNVIRYGSNTVQGTTDMTAAIQAACASNRTVYFPAGTYSVTGGIEVECGTRFQGDSAGYTVISLSGDMAGEYDAVFEVVVTAANFLTSQAGFICRDLFITGGQNFAHGFLLRNIRFPVFENVWIFAFDGSALVCDYVEEGHFDFLNINTCGRTSGTANTTADTLFGQITFTKSADVYAASENNFLRFNDCTIANGNCSGDIMINGCSPSRMYFTRCQSEISGGSIGNRDWLIAGHNGGIFYIEDCDMVNYRNAFDQAEYIELHTSQNRITNSTKIYAGANGTAPWHSVDDYTDGAIDHTSAGTVQITGGTFGAATFQYINKVKLTGVEFTSMSVSNVGATPKLRMIGCDVSGNLSVGAYEDGVVAHNVVGGTASYGAGTRAIQNVVTGAETFDAATDVAKGYIGSIASAASLTIPRNLDAVNVTGTTNITSIATTGMDGRLVTLIFSDVLTVTDGSNLNLAGNFVTSSDDTLTLRCFNGFWFEVARSAI